MSNRRIGSLIAAFVSIPGATFLIVATILGNLPGLVAALGVIVLVGIR